MRVDQEIKRGTFFVFISKYSNILIGLVINSILARFLSPNEYGIVGVVTVFITFFSILGDIGVGTAIVQNRNLTGKDISDIFKINILLSTCLGLAFFLLSYGIAWFYESDIYIRIGQLLAISVFFSSMSGVPRSLLMRDKSFKLLGAIEITSNITTGLLVVFLAMKGNSYYSIVWRSILSSMMTFTLCLYFSRLRLVQGFGFGGFRKIARYSGFQFAFNFINYFSRNLDNILIGKFMGNQNLGIYSQSYQLMMYPVANLTHVITPVLHPVLARFVDQPKIIFEEYLKVVNILAMLGIPISVFVFFSSSEIVYLVLGSKWMAVAPVLQIFGASIWLQMVNSSGGAIFQSMGRTDKLFKMGILSTFTTVSATLLGILYFQSLTYTALCISLAIVLNFTIVYYVLISRILNSSFTRFLKVIAKHMKMAAALIVLLYLVQVFVNFKQDNANLIYVFVIKAAVLGITFLAFHYEMVMGMVQKVFTNVSARIRS
ncbi:polysaccharide transporter, PST family [Dyadobacter soli]|uniref:Polysaccharide transporter, PST family n=1 Tax=Dyadobacter soli TaxID=659014 RepID=A0A1G7FZT9_9BACT|nr:lipopolysaccharide biosynthesis protein [Dyadobacter soli]SDE81320.1 polysaccharide transporter, PST family [Dyadobacter soli]